MTIHSVLSTSRMTDFIEFYPISLWHFKNNFIYLLFIAVQAFPSCSKQASHCSGFSYCGARAPGRSGFGSCGSQALKHRCNVMVCRLSCYEACEIFPDQGSNLCSLHWKADSLPLRSREDSPFDIWHWTFLMTRGIATKRPEIGRLSGKVWR